MSQNHSIQSKYKSKSRAKSKHVKFQDSRITSLTPTPQNDKSMLDLEKMCEFLEENIKDFDYDKDKENNAQFHIEENIACYMDVILDFNKEPLK